ncbi:uncharacterized protein PODANS_7_490 [Podospora anserina S mat+]|uniref:Glycosyltransferase Family 55 n=1 Tax=Podospora anserina (strain S / ATCC MYA-4624 / DSM 980 / FGSC 10383) TaxID=515849 RepID=B2AP59_PODAN|nr:uncharacterized protein PODANS_7_490 [Podospora anserina S mat+]CAP65753.1 unnamed protein product [Podospora anserina S mat+]CDP32812.1 Putative Glycosyltransferase Family 55 [Podospora anserina S mat+]
MRYTLPLGSRPFGPLCIMPQMEVVELEPRPTNRDNRLYGASELSGLGRTGHQSQRRPQHNQDPDHDAESTVAVFPDELDRILEKLVIVVPCKDEPVDVIRGVIAGIPSRCAVILVSNCSHQHGENGWEAQERMLAGFCAWGREGCFVHQQYPGAAMAFKEAGVPEILDTASGRIRNGKGEGMYLGIAMAKSYFPHHQYIGFIDADNRIPGSVVEYCKAYAGGFALAQRSAAKSGTDREDVMVRISWASKPKYSASTGRIEFVQQGRSSRIINSFLNRLFAKAGQQDEFITTGNAGEHAMTMEMALKMRMANGYAIEPFQYIEPLLRNKIPSANLPNASQTTRIVQIKTANPHLHRETGDEHIIKMWAAGLGALYHHLLGVDSVSGLGTTTLATLRKDMHRFALQNSAIQGQEELPRPNIYPSLDNTDLDSFRDVLGEPCSGHVYGGLGFYGLVDQAWASSGTNSPASQSTLEHDSWGEDDQRSSASSEEEPEVLSDSSKQGE